MARQSALCPTEAEEQTWLFKWAANMLFVYPELELMCHIPNGGSRNKIEAARLKAQGVKAGMPDIFLPVAIGKYHGLFIEMKRKHGGVLSQQQKEKIAQLREQGYRVEVCAGFQMAADVVEEYLGDKIVKRGVCQDCENRAVGCHAVCAKFLAESIMREKEKNKRQKKSG